MEETQRSARQCNRKLIVLGTVWLLAGVLLFFLYGHISCLFPVILFGWILAGVTVWRMARQRGGGNLLTLLLMAIVLCLLASLIYLEWANYEYGRGLREFVAQVAGSTTSGRGFHPSSHGCDWRRWQRDFTADYEAELNDTFGVERQWIVEFSNGTRYSIVMVPVSLRQWEICVRPLR